MPEVRLLILSSPVPRKYPVCSACIPGIHLHRRQAHFTIMQNPFTRSSKWVKLGMCSAVLELAMTMSSRKANAKSNSLRMSFLNCWIVCDAYYSLKGIRMNSKSPNVVIITVLEHLPNELEFGTKPVQDQVWRRWSFCRGMPKNVAKVGLDINCISWQHWVRNIHHESVIKLAFS